MNQVYFSKALDPADWSGKDAEYATFFLVPRKWWSIEAWGFCWAMRASMLQELAKLLNSRTKEVSGGR